MVNIYEVSPRSGHEVDRLQIDEQFFTPAGHAVYCHYEESRKSRIERVEKRKRAFAFKHGSEHEAFSTFSSQLAVFAAMRQKSGRQDTVRTFSGWIGNVAGRFVAQSCRASLMQIACCSSSRCREPRRNSILTGLAAGTSGSDPRIGH